MPARGPYSPSGKAGHQIRSVCVRCSCSYYPDKGARTEFNIIDNFHATQMNSWNVIYDVVPTSNTQVNCLTASAVPWNQFMPASPGVCVAAKTCLSASDESNHHKNSIISGQFGSITSTNPSPKLIPFPKLYVREMWRFSEAELNCVIMKILFIPLLMQLLIGMSISL